MQKDRVCQFIEELIKEEMVKKNLYEFPWLSGSTTIINPIERYSNSREREVVLQWKSNRKCNAFISKMVRKYNDIIIGGTFWKSDGSCPSRIIFRLKKAET